MSDTIQLHDFPESEYLDRARRAARWMAEESIDAIVVTADWSASMNYRYFSGHQPRDFQMSFSRPHVMILTSDQRAALVVHYASVENAKELSWVQDVRSCGQPFDGMSVVDALKHLGLEKSRIGWELGIDQRLLMPVAEFLKIREQLPAADFVDAAKVITSTRLYKSALEVEALKAAAQINHRAQEEAFATVKPGMSEHDVYVAVMRGLISHGSHRPPVAQINTNSTTKFRDRGGFRARLLGPSTTPLGAGDLVSVDSGCPSKGYWMEFDRVVSVGEPTTEQKDYHSIARELVQDPIETVLKPGVSFREVVEHVISLYKKHNRPESDYAKYIRDPFMHFCHGLGMSASEAPLIRIDVDSVLEPGMMLSVEAGITTDAFRYHSEEAVVITESGNDLITEIDRGVYFNA